MGKPILYRAKAINRIKGNFYRTKYKNGDWVYGLVTRLSPKYNEAEMRNTDGIDGIDVDIDTISEYIGIDDIVGTMIFDGDILEFEFETIGKQLAVVKYSTQFNAGFLLEPINNFAFTTTDKGRVVGNIFDNPELLKKKKK